MRRKRAHHNTSYGAGDQKLGSIVAPTASAKEQIRAGKGLRKNAEERIPGLGDLQKAVKQAVKARGILKGLDGRIMPVRSAHSALNTLLQAAGAIIMKEATVLFHQMAADKAWEHGYQFRQVASVHDELQLEVLPEWAEDVGQLLVEAMRRVTDTLNLRCPLDGEYQIGPNWSATH